MRSLFCAFFSSMHKTVKNWFFVIMKTLCICHFGSIKIRFYAVSQMYDMGMDEKDIMALAGHSNVTTTRHYNRRLKEISMSDAQLKAGFGR